MLDLLNRADTWLFLALNGFHNPAFDTFFVGVTCKWTWVPFYAVLAYLIFKRKKQTFFLILLSVICAITLSDQLSSTIIKPFVARLRPCHEPLLSGLVHIVNDACGGQYGFVSSHAANVFALATLIMLLLKDRKLTALTFSWAALVSISRVYLGVHYPGDIAAGAAIGIGISYVVFELYQRIERSYFKSVHR